MNNAPAAEPQRNTRSNVSPQATFGFHELWHVMTVAAAGCHYALILMLVRA